MEPTPCVHCFDLFHPSPRHKNQTHCMKPECRRAMKAAWKRLRMKTDPDFKDNQRISNKKWAANHPGYWKNYRLAHPEKAEADRILQVLRNRRRRCPTAIIAKVDSSTPQKNDLLDDSGWFRCFQRKVDSENLKGIATSGYQISSIHIDRPKPFLDCKETDEEKRGITVGGLSFPKTWEALQ